MVAERGEAESLVVSITSRKRHQRKDLRMVGYSVKKKSITDNTTVDMGTNKKVKKKNAKLMLNDMLDNSPGLNYRISLQFNY